jgi:hypothetical protein
MPSLLRRPSSLASSSSEESDWLNEHAIVSDKEYNAIYFDGCAEKPISEQLEPIAVVGMGNVNFSPEARFNLILTLTE